MGVTPPGIPGNGMLERLLRTNEDQARAAGALVELQRTNAVRAEKIEDELKSQTSALTSLVKHMEHMENARVQAVNDVKNHVDDAVKAGFQASETWWRRTVWIVGIIIAISNLVGVGIARLLEVLKIGQ